MQGVVAELRAGRKTGHWMCHFPQVTGLGQSELSRRYAIGWSHHPVLGPRLFESAQGSSCTHQPEIFGGIGARGQAALVDDAARSGDARRAGVGQVIDRYFDGVQRATDDRLRWRPHVSSPSPRVPVAVVVGLFVASLALRQQLLSIGPLLPLIQVSACPPRPPGC